MLNRILLAGTAAFLLSGAAFAQVPPDAAAPAQPMAPGPMAAPPVGTLSTEHTEHAVDAYGNETSKKETIYRNSQGVAADSQTTTTTAAPPPPPPAATTTTTTTSTDTTIPK